MIGELLQDPLDGPKQSNQKMLGRATAKLRQEQFYTFENKQLIILNAYWHNI